MIQSVQFYGGRVYYTVIPQPPTGPHQRKGLDDGTIFKFGSTKRGSICFTVPSQLKINIVLYRLTYIHEEVLRDRESILLNSPVAVRTTPVWKIQILQIWIEGNVAIAGTSTGVIFLVEKGQVGIANRTSSNFRQECR